MQRPIAPTEHPMPDALPPRSVFSAKQWAAIQAAQAQQQAEGPAGPVAGVPEAVWAAMTPAEQAKLYADQANQQAIVQAQRESGRRISSTLWIILVLIPLAAFLIIMALSSVH